MSTLIDIAIEQILFFANASDKDVHPDVAVSQLESLVAELVELPATELASVRASVQERLMEATGPERQALTELDSMLE
ncbi:hypothetical protein [Kribbella sp. NPDC051620]|uniref:hypothetical protein n=1 Tax=Kribbella sp. NPDC051620 TaxID=3364120 RepID=UPI00379BFFDE